MRTDRKDEHYWTLIDSSGKIEELPRTLKRVLASDDYIKMSAKHIYKGYTQLLLESNDKIAAFKLGLRGNIVETL